MKRKLISTLLAIIGLTVIGFATLFFIGLFDEQEAGILIESDPVSKVFINNYEVGTTPYESNMKSGEINIKIKPIDVNGMVFDDYETKINLVSGIKTIIKRSFSNSDENSSGITVSFEKNGGQKAYVTAVSIPDGAKVSIDGKGYGYTPVRVEIPAGDHDLLISAEGYQDKSLPIKVYKGYKLTTVVKLAKVKSSDIETAVPVSQIPKLGRIKIEKTDTGFLRVRSGANTGFPEVGQVKPDEEYEILEVGEQGRWYKIKFGEIEGWVAAEFVTKL